MPWSVEIFFDSQADELVRGVWEELSRQNLHGQPPPPSARPHVSLGVWAQIDPCVARPSLEQFASRIQQLKFHFASIGVFAATGVVYFAPTVTEQILQNHAEFHEHFVCGKEIRDYYRPGNWTPHCTIAERVDPQNISLITQIAMEANLPFIAEARSIGLVQHPGAHLLFEVAYKHFIY